MKLSEMQYYKEQYGLSYDKLSELSGIPKGTIQKIFTGVTKNPRYDTLMALEKALHKNPFEQAGESTHAERVSESVSYGVQQKKQGEYTLEDYYAIPEERRVELIDGVIYDMASPTTIHQLLVARIWSLLDRHITEKGGDCIPLFSPLDVQLDRDNKTMVQPDVIVMCDRDRMEKHIYGEPDFAVEVLSPSSRRIDNVLKLRKYAGAGVKEYWIVDPEKKKVLAYNFQEGDWPAIYGFEDKIPVHIFPEPWEMDFSEIYNYIKFMYEK